MPTRPVASGRPTAVRAELSGKWIVWNAEHSQIVAQAETLQELWQFARLNQIRDPVFEKVPRAEVRFVGTR